MSPYRESPTLELPPRRPRWRRRLRVIVARLLLGTHVGRFHCVICELDVVARGHSKEAALLRAHTSGHHCIGPSWMPAATWERINATPKRIPRWG